MSNSITKLIINDSEITSEKEIPDTFCNYYSELTTTITNIDRQHIPMPEHTSTMECPPITIEEVLKAIKNLKSNKPIGSDGIPA